MMMMMMEWAAVKVLVDRQLPTSQSPVAVGSFKICSRQATAVSDYANLSRSVKFYGRQLKQAVNCNVKVLVDCQLSSRQLLSAVSRSAQGRQLQCDSA